MLVERKSKKKLFRFIFDFRKEINLEGKWEGKTAGGRSSNSLYHKNPHFKIKFTTDDNQPKTLIIALMQKNIREEKKLCLKIGFDVYKVEYSVSGPSACFNPSKFSVRKFFFFAPLFEKIN